MLSATQRRRERLARNGNMVDMNLVSLIDVFTILIFFLLSSATGVEILPSAKAVTLPESVSDTLPRNNLLVVVNSTDILVQGQRVAAVADVLAAGEGAGVIAPVQAALQASVGSAGGATPPPGVTIMGDKGIPYQLLRKVMASCAAAGLSEVSFAVRQKEL